ncbi:MAG: sulfurtransferase [Bacteroidales bacterium]|nr:sulfurtransferase [Bacteroidales bacterium]
MKVKDLEESGARYSLFGLSVIRITLISLFSIQVVNGQVSKSEIPKEKQTTLGLYLTAREAYEKWKADPDKIRILDVRTPEEYLFVGHTEMALNIPLLFQSWEWDAGKNHFTMKPNPDFISLVKKIAGPTDTILVTCRSGGRSAKAVNKLAEAGFKNVYSITDGMEGDVIDDPESVFQGKRLKNGWKNSGIPWTYTVDPEKMFLPEKK